MEDRPGEIGEYRPPLPGGTASFGQVLHERGSEEMRTSLAFRGLDTTPLPAVLDTSFLFTGFQAQLRRRGAAPLSLVAARQGVIRLLMAEETIEEVLDKLAEFAESLRTTARRLEAFLINDWAPWITVVNLRGVPVDDRARVVTDRDPSDRSAAVLASLLSPCLLLTTDKDFESLSPVDPGGAGGLSGSVVAVSTTLIVDETAMQLRAIGMVPALPVAGLVGGVRWVGRHARVSPWILALVLGGGGVLLYRRMSPERRATTRSRLGEVGTTFLEEWLRAQTEHRAALGDLEKRIVPPVCGPTVEALVLRQLAVADRALSAQQLWELLDPAARPAVTTVRETLRRHPAAVWTGRGLWTLGVPLRWLLDSSR